jgi:adenylate cyclase
VVTRNHAEIYQYVGDEVVLTWKEGYGVKDNRCVATFFQYQDTIRGRDGYYRGTYGVVPEFKAGLHLGKVTVAEVGEIKKELAYHGDALNTAARVRSLCTSNNKRLLITEALLRVLPNLESDYSVQPLGESVLKGKDRSVRIFGVQARHTAVPVPA